MEEINNLVKEIKLSKKYKDISEEVIRAEVERYLKFNKKIKIKKALKEIKAKLHRLHGSFRLYNENERKEFLRKREFEAILETNKSTKERLEIYPELYERIFSITGKPNSILDLGSGINPISFYFMNLKKENIQYNSYDINEADKEIINEFFKQEKINGKAEILDLTRIENIKSLNNAEICFMFKLIDVLEENKKGHKYAEEVVSVLKDKTRFMVISFPTRTVSGKPMNFPYRGWIERMLNRIEMKFERLEFENEIFYVVECKK